MKFFYPLLFFVCLFSATCSLSQQKQTSEFSNLKNTVWGVANITAFEKQIEDLRERYHIPGISAGIVQGKKIIWKKGFGYADIENKIIPDENTVYHLASITKTFGSIILMQLVEEGKVNLDDPIAKYGINLGARWGSDERIKIKHLLTHTAMGNSFNGFKPGYSFRYNGDWYNRLGQVINQASGQTFGQLLMNKIIIPLNLKNTVPSLDDTINFNLTGYNREAFIIKVAKPYDWHNKKIAPVHFSYGFGPAAGIMSSVSDLAVYSVAIDEKKFLKPETWEKIFTPFVSPKGKIFQYGLGWFVKYYNGTKVMWHTGWWLGFSTLLIKIPDKDLTFIILANSQDLSRPFYSKLNPIKKTLNKNLKVSPFAKAFIDHFAEF